MRLFDLFEQVLSVEINSKWHESRIKILKNPSSKELISWLNNSIENELRGLIVGRDVYWWDAFLSYHAHIAELFDPDYPAYDHDNRLGLKKNNHGDIAIDADEKFLTHPQIVREMQSNEILFNYTGRGLLTYREIQNILAESENTLKLPDIEKGDKILVGKFKNRKAQVTGFTTDDHKQPVLKTTKGPQKLFKPRIVKLDEKLIDEKGFSIREISPDELYELSQKAPNKNIFKEIKYLDQGEFRKEIHIVAFLKKQVIGIGGLQVNPYDKKELWVKFISVNSKFQRNGIGKAILETVYQYAVQHKLKVVPSSFTEQGQGLKAIHTRLDKEYPEAASGYSHRDF